MMKLGHGSSAGLSRNIVFILFEWRDQALAWGGARNAPYIVVISKGAIADVDRSPIR
jgi:hypothetical protein